jgi:hypothetical protein
MRNLPELPVCVGNVNCHDAFVPSVCKNLPLLPDCPGNVEVSAALNTNAVVANLVELSPAVTVGAVGVPLRAGDMMSALLFIAVSIRLNSCRIFEDKPREPDTGLPVLV